MGEKAFYNAYTLGAVLSGLDTLANPVHPRVAEWAINENARFESKFPKRSYVRKVRGEWKVDETQYSMFRVSGGAGEYGIADPSMYASLIRTHGLSYDHTRDLRALSKRFHSELESLVQQWKRESQKTNPKWLNRYDSRRQAEKDVNAISEQYNVEPPTIRWTKGWPVSPATYNPMRKELLLHEWLWKNSRKCDMAILALHEIVGHHHQEQRAHVPSAAAESCAMSCESLVAEVTGSMAPAIEWRCMRLCRAILDLRLHMRIGDYPIPENVWSEWSAQLGDAFDYIVPLPSETLRVAALPGQALGYVVPSRTSKRGCHEKCTA